MDGCKSKTKQTNKQKTQYSVFLFTWICQHTRKRHQGPHNLVAMSQIAYHCQTLTAVWHDICFTRSGSQAALTSLCCALWCVSVILVLSSSSLGSGVMPRSSWEGFNFPIPIPILWCGESIRAQSNENSLVKRPPPS